MAGSYVSIDTSELENFVNRLNIVADGRIKEDFKFFLDGIGTEFLRIVQDEIIRLQVVDTRLLLNSFTKGGADNVFKIQSGNLTLEIGTNVKYASYVNDGHWLNSNGVATRWVPGVWSGHRFIYTPGAKTGMLLKQRYIEGTRYFDSAVDIIKQMLPELLDRKVEQWARQYFSDFM